MPGAYMIEEANAKLKRLLGPKFGLVTEVPPGYFHPELQFPFHMGHAARVLALTISPNAPSILPVIEPTLWALLNNITPKVSLLSKAAWVLIKEWGIRQKDSQKVLEINFLFKHLDQQDAVLQSLRASNPEADACAVDTDPPNWRSDYKHFLDEGYIRQLFSDPWPVKEAEALLELAPPSNCPINTREAAKTMAVDMERACQALLQQMFEVQKYPPLDESVGAECIQYVPKDHIFLIALDPNYESPEYAPSNPALEADAKQVEAVITQVVEQSKNKGSTQGPPLLLLLLLMQDLQTAVLSRPQSLMPAFLMEKKPHHAKPAELASDSTVRPTSDSTATHRSNRSKLKEEALPAEPTKAKAKWPCKGEPQKKGLGGGRDSEGVASSTVLGSPQTLAPKYRVRTYQKCPAQPQDIGKGPEKAAPPLLAPQKSQTGRMAHSDLARFDGIAAEVAEGLEGPGDEGDGFSGFPADQFEEPLDSEEEQRRLLGLPTASETEEFGPNAGHTTYSKNPGEALEDAEAPKLAEEQAEWCCQTKGKGKETEAEVDNEADEEELDEAHMKPLVSRLTKSQMECVKQQVEEERGQYATLAQEMFDHSGAIGDPSKREGEASREGKEGYKTWAKNISIQLEEIEAKVNQKTFLGSSRVSALKKLGKDLSEKGFIEKRNSQSRQNYNLYDLAAVGFVAVLGLAGGAAVASALVFAPSRKIGGIVEQIFWMPANKWKFMYSLGALNLAEAETFEPLIKGWEAYTEANPLLLEDLHSTVLGKLLEMANQVLKQNGVLESWGKKGWPYLGLANVIYDLLNKDKGSIVVGFVKGAHSQQEGYHLIIPGTILYMEAFSKEPEANGGTESVNIEDMEDGNLPLVFDQKKNPLLCLWDSTKWQKMDAAQKAKEGKNRPRSARPFRLPVPSLQLLMPDLEDAPPSFREVLEDDSGAEIAPERPSKMKQWTTLPRAQEPRKMVKPLHQEAYLNQGAAGMPPLVGAGPEQYLMQLR
ncbi:hypothetical protein BS47DRAFT_1365878 [Hydnum rufescens UP504]|uniref:Uncharacterized protein n=1 Tax=Hydnum rufescens UP504 TaxID=1448309 RepID=A0A9P6DP21_9AGAM|nr:hypothetical protein BS47DRAFT_1365878 [Hydnum rufescens UP504]